MDTLRDNQAENLLEHFWERPISRRQAMRLGAGLGISAIGTSFLSACGRALPGAAISNGSTPVAPVPAQYLVMIIIDAARADYLQYGHLPNIQALMARGTVYDRAWVGQMESITPASHATIGTGCFPKHDGGILGFWWEDPTTQSNYTCAPLDASDPGRVERIIAAAHAPTLAGLLKEADPRARMYTASGHKFYAADGAGGPEADFINYFWTDSRGGWSPVSIAGHDLPEAIVQNPVFRAPNWKTMPLGQQDALVADMSLEVVRQERPRIMILNLPEMDWPVAHINGGPVDPPAVTTLMENADRALGKIISTYRDLGILDRTAFMLLGDHGVIPTEHLVDPSPVDLAVKNGGTQIVTADYHTGGFVWLEDPSRAAKVADFLDYSKMPGVSGVYFLAQAQGQSTYLPSPATAMTTPPHLDSAYRYLMETMNGPDAPHVVLVYPERTGTAGAGGGVVWKGDHGGTSWGSHAVPLILAGAGVRSGRVSHFPARLVDIAPTVLRLLGVPYPRLDGVTLADAFVRPHPADTAAQSAVATYLVPIAETLRRQSRLEAPGPIRTSASNPHKKSQVVAVSPSY